MIKLTKQEQETIILYNEAESEATCYTHNKSLMRKLDEIRSKSSSLQLISEDEHSRTYTFPKRWVKVQMPRVLTEEQRQKLSDRAKRNLGKAKEGDDTASV